MIDNKCLKMIDNDEIKDLLLLELEELQKYLNNNNIPFFMAGGTLLGAVRHHGFIPWDDDVDIFIKQDQYYRLLELIKENPYLDNLHRYKLMLPAVFPNFYPIIKLVDTKTVVYEKGINKKYAMGLWIDIFCMSYWPEKMKEAKRLAFRERFLNKLLAASVGGNYSQTRYRYLSGLLSIARVFLRLIGMTPERLSKKMVMLANNTPSSYIGNLSFTSGIKDRYPAAYYEQLVNLEFGTLCLPAPKEYDKVLTAFYGDYMTLPPLEKRVRHDFTGYYTE